MRASRNRTPARGRHSCVQRDSQSLRPRGVPRLPVALVSALALGAAGCSGSEPVSDSSVGPTATSSPPSIAQASSGDIATWRLLDPTAVTPETSTLELGVTRLDCANGRTGRVLEPVVKVEDERIVIRTDVETFTGGADCPGNDEAPVTVELDQRVGARNLVDAACLRGGAVGTFVCADGPVRWVSPASGASETVPDWTEPADYSFVVDSSCGERSFIGRYAVVVRDGEVSRVEALAGGWDGVTPDQTPTIAEMLASARDAEPSAEVEIAMDEAGVPTWISIDHDLRAIDDEECYLLSDVDLSEGRG